MKILELTWTAYGHYNRAHVVDPDGTSVAAVSEASRALIEAHKAFHEIDRERGAQPDPERLEESLKEEARNLALLGKAVKPKDLRKKLAAAEEHRADVDLEWEGAAATLADRRQKYYAAIAHNAPALSAEADTNVEAALMSLASASATARRAEAALSGGLALQAALSATRDGSEFVPVAPRAKSGGLAGAPGPYVSEALENITTAIGYGSEIRDDLRGDKHHAAEVEDEPDDEGTDGE